MKDEPANVDDMICPCYTFVVEERDFFVPTMKLQDISPVLFIMAHHAPGNVVWLDDIDKYEFSILYNFYVAGLLPQQDVLMPTNRGMHLLQLADYLLATTFKDFLQSEVFCAILPPFPYSNSVIHMFQLSIACNAQLILQDTALHFSTNLEKAYASRHFLKMHPDEFLILLRNIHCRNSPLFRHHLVQLIVTYSSSHFQRYLPSPHFDTIIYDYLMACPQLTTAKLTVEDISSQTARTEKPHYSYVNFIIFKLRQVASRPL